MNLSEYLEVAAIDFIVKITGEKCVGIVCLIVFWRTKLTNPKGYHQSVDIILSDAHFNRVCMSQNVIHFRCAVKTNAFYGFDLMLAPMV